MRRIDRKDLRAPAYVLDLELRTSGSSYHGAVDVDRYNTIWCLSRFDGIPQKISFWDVADDAALSVSTLREQLRAEMRGNENVIQGALSQRTASLNLTVVICTRDRPEGLRSTLSSLQHQVDDNFRVIVVDNGSKMPESADIVRELNLPRYEYISEHRPGLSRARNRGLGAVKTELVAWIDDDEVADADWVGRIKEGFMHEARPVAVCGAMLPAELEFEAQVRFEQFGGFNKGRGMASEVLRAGTSSVVSPLYPLPPFGPGGNMSFRTEYLLSAGGFDPCLGAGTRTHGGEETRVMSALLSAGHAVLHWPPAITWHTHRREMAALKRQFYGYSAGTSAFYASMIRSRPTTTFGVLRLVPQAIRDFRSGSDNQRSGHLPEDFPPYLLKAARRGLLEGAFMYGYEVIRDFRESIAAARDNVQSACDPDVKANAGDVFHS